MTHDLNKLKDLLRGKLIQLAASGKTMPYKEMMRECSLWSGNNQDRNAFKLALERIGTLEHDNKRPWINCLLTGAESHYELPKNGFIVWVKYLFKEKFGKIYFHNEENFQLIRNWCFEYWNNHQEVKQASTEAKVVKTQFPNQVPCCKDNGQAA